MTEARPVGRVQAWLHAVRIPTLAAAFVPVAVGTALAARDHHFRFAPALLALWGAIFIQIGTNLVNDLGDFHRGADTGPRLGPQRALAMGWLTEREIRTGIAVSFALATLAGLLLARIAGPAVIVIGIASILAGAWYTAGPWPLAYHGLGELFVFLFFGVVAVCGTYYVQARTVSLDALLASIPVGSLSTAILVVNNVRDLEGDRDAGKRTLAVRMGRRATRWGYVLLLAAAYVTPLALMLMGRAAAWALLPFLTLPLALREGRRVTREQGARLNAALLGTARLHVLFGLLLAAGLWIA
jgi:1,4-dihydroxy-2-naphthoate polyprenyltransferase